MANKKKSEYTDQTPATTDVLVGYRPGSPNTDARFGVDHFVLTGGVPAGQTVTGTLNAGVIGTTEIKSDVPSATDLTIATGAAKTLKLGTPVWGNLRVVPGGMALAGTTADPTLVAYTPGGSGTATMLYEFSVNDLAYFCVQMPPSYAEGTDIYCHIHWTPGARGNEENGALVGWKVDYTWVDIGDAMGTMTTLDLSDACNGVDHEHQITPDVMISGSGHAILSMLVCNVKRTDTGTDDTWASSTTGQLPMLLEVDFHYQIDTIGSRTKSAK